MKKWNLPSVKQAITSVPECTITNVGLPEDVVTEQISVAVRGTKKMVYIRGFRTDGINPAKDANRVEMVEVSTGYSDGDMPNDPEYCVVHAKVKAAIMKLGYPVVNSLEPYF